MDDMAPWQPLAGLGRWQAAGFGRSGAIVGKPHGSGFSGSQEVDWILVSLFGRYMGMVTPSYVDPSSPGVWGNSDQECSEKKEEKTRKRIAVLRHSMYKDICRACFSTLRLFQRSMHGVFGVVGQVSFSGV